MERRSRSVRIRSVGHGISLNLSLALSLTRGAAEGHRRPEGCCGGCAEAGVGWGEVGAWGGSLGRGPWGKADVHAELRQQLRTMHSLTECVIRLGFTYTLSKSESERAATHPPSRPPSLPPSVPSSFPPSLPHSLPPHLSHALSLARSPSLSLRPFSLFFALSCILCFLASPLSLLFSLLVPLSSHPPAAHT